MNLDSDPCKQGSEKLKAKLIGAGRNDCPICDECTTAAERELGQTT